MKKVEFYQGGNLTYAWTPGDKTELSPRHKKVANSFNNKQFTNILDIGCGDGKFALLLKTISHASKAYGIEMSADGVENSNNIGVETACIDIDNDSFPYSDSYFDAIHAGEIIEHLYDPDHLLEEIYRVLKPQGFLVISTPNIASWFNRIALLLGYQPYGNNPSLKNPVGHICEFKRDWAIGAEHIRMFTLRSLNQLLNIHGFTIIKTIGTYDPVSGFPFSGLWTMANKSFSLFPCLSHRIIINAQKR